MKVCHTDSDKFWRKQTTFCVLNINCIYSFNIVWYTILELVDFYLTNRILQKHRTSTYNILLESDYIEI